MPHTRTHAPPTAPGATGPAAPADPGRPERRPRYVYDFAEGDRWMADLLGGKGANLAEMTRLGLPVPPGFTITTEACRSYLSTGREPATLREEIGDHLAALERRMGRRLGRGADPLLVSVRSGARFSMPGMMETVLDVGLSDTSVRALAGQAGDDRFAWDSYRRLIQMFGRTVLGIDGSHFDAELEAARREEGVEADASLPAVRLRALVEEFKRITRVHGGRDFPQDPREQLTLAVDAVFDSWNTDRARRYRRQEHIPDDLGTAVSVCAMVFGNLGPDSGTGVAFTRDPATGRTGVYGDYLRNAQGEDVVAGYRNTVPLAELERIDPGSHRRLTEIMATLERHYLDLCDIEFTIERGTLWMLQTRVGKRTAAAAFRIAADLAEQEVIDDDEALRRVDGSQLAQLMFPHFDPAHRGEPVARGVPASPGAAVGAAVFDSARAAARAARGERVVLVRRETNPDDLDGMLAAEGVLTSRGGKTSHAAVVARGMGRTCVCGAEGIVVDADARRATVPGGGVIEEGDVLSVDGTDGSVHLGEVPVVPSTVVEYFENGGTPTGADPTTGEDPDDGRDDALVRAVDRLMRHADRRRVLGVRANADTGRDARRAARFGAAGVGLCRTEHMFLGERRRLVERLVLAVTDREREEVLAELLPLQRADFTELLAAMDGMPVTVRLLDPPLHEFLPDITELSVRVARAGDEGDDSRDHRLLRAVRRLHEQNPMLGLRGVRLGLVVPGLFAMQVRAVAEAAADRRAAGGDPRPEIMVPLVAAARELEIVREEAERVLAEVAARRGSVPTVPVGTMIELPRAALTAGEIAGAADFFSFGTNDLTQTVWGFSRDDVEGSFFAGYLERGVFPVSPFETIDAAGVGTLVRTAARTGRATSPDLGLGVCGEHGGDPASVRFFHEAGLDYVSCSPFRVPVARLEAGRAAVGGR